MPRLDGYEPRHIAEIEDDFCNFGCVIIDGIKVPFPDCESHGKPFTTKAKCGTMEA